MSIIGWLHSYLYGGYMYESDKLLSRGDMEDNYIIN